jgi:hypothetical protein
MNHDFTEHARYKQWKSFSEKIDIAMVTEAQVGISHYREAVHSVTTMISTEDKGRIWAKFQPKYFMHKNFLNDYIVNSSEALIFSSGLSFRINFIVYPSNVSTAINPGALLYMERLC